MTHYDPMTIEGRTPVPTEPNPSLNALNRLIGTWTVSGPGELGGTVRYEWMDGGFFLIRHVDVIQAGQRVKGVEYIGHDPSSDTLASHYFDSSGALLRYVYQLDGDTHSFHSFWSFLPEAVDALTQVGRFARDLARSDVRPTGEVRT